jgi:hypothetical protein
MSEKPSIFVSAPAATKTGLLRTILTESGADVIDAFDFGPGQSLSQTLISRILKSDGVVIVYSDASPNVVYEMGISVASKKPTLILVDPNISLPAFAESFLFLRTTLKDTEVLRASLVRFVEETRKKQPRQIAPLKRAHGASNVEAISSFLDLVGVNRKSVTPQQIESALMEILKNSGVQVEVQMSRRDVGVDCVVWSERLRQTMGNPILVQLKVGNVSRENLKNTERQLLRYLGAVDAHYGVIFYLDRAGTRLHREALSPNILAFDLEDFARTLQHHSFEEVLLTERNRVVHGGRE